LCDETQVTSDINPECAVKEVGPKKEEQDQHCSGQKQPGESEQIGKFESKKLRE
jgi:hypothetical protein